MRKIKTSMHRHFLLSSHFFLAATAFALRASAAVPLRFAADAESPRTHQASAYRGETLDIEARLTWRGAPLAVSDGAEAAMCWQTNGMGDAWWTAPASVTTCGVVTATWSPSNDVGAASYRVFLRVAGPGGASYRANMLLRILGSPGETPNALPLPVQVLDFARISYTNEPWAISGLTTNDVRAIVEADAGPTNLIVRADGDGNVHVAGIFAGEEGTGTSGFAGSFDGTVDVYGGLYVFGEAYLNDEKVAVKGDLAGYATRTNLPSLSADATVGDLVDQLNAVIGALKKEEQP